MKNLILAALLVALLCASAFAGATNAVGTTVLSFSVSNQATLVAYTWNVDETVTNIRIAVTAGDVGFETNPRGFGYTLAGTATNWAAITHVAAGSAITLRTSQLAGNGIRAKTTNIVNNAVTLTLNP